MTIDIESVSFIVQRDDGQFECLGRDLNGKLIENDLLLVQRGSTASMLQLKEAQPPAP